MTIYPSLILCLFKVPPNNIRGGAYFLTETPIKVPPDNIRGGAYFLTETPIKVPPDNIRGGAYFLTETPISYTTTVIICDYYSKGWLGSAEKTFSLVYDATQAFVKSSA